MEVAEKIKDVRRAVKAARDKGKTIGLVPTMGALHAGHMLLIERAVKKTDYLVVSIFVNPTQFGPGEDFDKYPRPFEADLEKCRKWGVELVFAPKPYRMYPRENLTWVNVERLTEPLCGKFRPGHFRAVTTVCAKLFNIVQPDIAFFGQKDAQQAVVIKRMVEDLNLPLEIDICPTVREPDGLAVSSRNKYLSTQQRKDAVYLYKSLQRAGEMLEAGEKNTRKIISEMQNILSRVPFLEVQYINLVDAQTLEEPEQLKGEILVAIAAKLGPARLIDNILIDLDKT